MRRKNGAKAADHAHLKKSEKKCADRLHSKKRDVSLGCDGTESTPDPAHEGSEDGAFGRPRQRQTRREAGTQSYGLLTVRGGTDKAARLPKGWTGPVSMLGLPGLRKESRIIFCADALTPLNQQHRSPTRKRGEQPP